MWYIKLSKDKQDTDFHRGIWAQKNGMVCECNNILYPFLLLEIFFPKNTSIHE